MTVAARNVVNRLPASTRRQEVPLRYLEQIFQELRRAHLVEAKRGPKGGYFLARKPEHITVGDVMRAVQGPLALLSSGEEGKSIWPNIWNELGEKIGAVF